MQNAMKIARHCINVVEKAECFYPKYLWDSGTISVTSTRMNVAVLSLTTLSTTESLISIWPIIMDLLMVLEKKHWVDLWTMTSESIVMNYLSLLRQAMTCGKVLTVTGDQENTSWPVLTKV